MIIWKGREGLIQRNTDNFTGFIIQDKEEKATVWCEGAADASAGTLKAGDIYYDSDNKKYYYVDKVNKYETLPNGSSLSASSVAGW